jgi:hypothetical protein
VRRLALALFLLLAAAPAMAADRLAVMAVADAPRGPGGDLAELTHQLRAACRDRAGGVLDVPEMRARLLGQVAPATLAELERAYAAALATFDAEDFQGAAGTLRAVAEGLEKLPDAAEVHAAWARTVVRLAFVERQLGRSAAATQALERLAALEPGFAVEERDYPPSFRREAAEVRRRVAARPRVRLTITARQPVQAFVNGKPLGPTPASFALPPGRYRVSAVAGEVHVAPVAVQLEEGDRAVELDLALAEALHLDAGPGLAVAPAERAALLVRAGAAVGATRLVAVSEVADGEVRFLDGAIYDLERGALLREGRVRMAAGAVSAPQLGALAAFLLTGQPARDVAPIDLAVATAEAAARTAAARAPSGAGAWARPAAPAPASTAPRHAWLKPGAYGAGAVALGLAGVAAWQGLTAYGRYQDADAMIRTDGVLAPGATQQAYDDKRASADAAKRNAYLAAGGTLVFAATAGVLGYLSWDDAGAPVVRF